MNTTYLMAGSTLQRVSRILLLCLFGTAYPKVAQTVQVTNVPRHEETMPPGSSGADARWRNLRFAHLTTRDGLSQGYVTAILQDLRGFMWFATRDGLNRFDGNSFVVYKHNPNERDSLSSNFIQDLLEDEHGYLWIVTNTGVNRFDPTTERFTRYLHEDDNPNSIAGAYVTSIARDGRGFLWFGTEASGVDKFDPVTQTFTHYRNDVDGRFVGRIAQVIADRDEEIWLVGERGLLHLNPATGQITCPPGTRSVRGAENVYEDEVGNLWMLANSPMVGLVKYDRHEERLTKYPLGTDRTGIIASTTTGGSVNSKLVPDGQNGLWVPSSQGLYHFDRRTEHFTYGFQHDETNPHSLDSNAILSVYQDRGGVLWVGTENAGLNLLNFEQEQFGYYGHRPRDPSSLSAGRVKAIYREPNGALWVGLFPRALDRLDLEKGQITHYTPQQSDENALHKGTNVDSIYKDAGGHLWIGGGGAGLDRFDERTGHFMHYGHNPSEPHSLLSDNVFTIYGDRKGQMWVGQQYGVSRFDPATGGFVNYRPDANHPASLENWVWVIYQDRSGTLWLGTFGGALIRFDDKAEKFVSYLPDPSDPHKLNGGGITSIHEDRTGTLWVGGFDGLYRFDGDGNFTRYTESRGLPSSTIRCILEDRVGRLWLSTQKGISRFDSQTERFRNYDTFDGLQSNEFSDGCYEASNGEMFFGGSNGLNAFFPDHVHDNPYVPPILITSFTIFNKPVSIGANSVLPKAIPYLDSLTLSYRDTVFSFEFAALSYANSHKNRYRYKLESFDRGWNEVDSKHNSATYTNLDPGRYLFRVQGSNSDGVWNEEGISLRILITPPLWKTNGFRTLCAAFFLGLFWAAYQLRVRQLQRQFATTLEIRVGERTRIARDLHDTLLQSFHGLLLRFQTVSILLPDRPIEAKEKLDSAIDQAAGAITEGRDAVQGLRASTVERNDLARSISTLGEELQTDSTDRQPVTFRVAVEGQSRELHPILRDEIYKIAAEALRNAFHHAQAKQIEVEIRYDHDQFRLRVRDDGKGIDPTLLSSDGVEGHYGLRGMRERATLIRGKLVVWSEVDAGAEVELRIPARIAYATQKTSWLSQKFAGTAKREVGDRS